MKRKFLVCLLAVMFSISLYGCKGCCAKSVELMGAGDRIHDSYTFANVGVKIKQLKENSYEIYGSVEKLDNDAVKKEFKIDEDVNNVVAVKLTAIDKNVEKDKVIISVNGIEAYDAEHLNGSDYTFIILEAIPDATVTITAKWNSTDPEEIYTIYFSDKLELK